MINFELYNPIRMVFGAGEFKRLGELTAEYGKKPLLVVGQYSAKEFGYLDRALEYLTEAGLDPVIFEGIEPNPHLETCQAAAHMAKENGCDVVVGVGGGSVMDASKMIAFGFYNPDDMWRRIARWEDGWEAPDKALPIILACTLAGTGSEGDAGAVVTNTKTNQKVAVFGECMFPKVSIIDPELTLSVPMDYVRDGVVDMVIHVLESYLNGDPSARFSDRCTEGFIAEVINSYEALTEKPNKIEPRSQLSWLAAIALQGFINKPRGGAFPLHAMQHPLSAHYDISHGRGLALLLPRWLRYVGRDNPDKIIQLGDRVFAMELESHHPFEAVEKVTNRIIEWFEDIGAWFFMDNLGIPNDLAMFRKMAEETIEIYGDENGLLGGLKSLTADDIVEIYKMCVRIGAPKEVTAPETKVCDEPEAEAEVEDVEIVEIIEEVIEIGEGEELPEGYTEGDVIVVEEIVEEVPEEHEADDGMGIPD